MPKINEPPPAYTACIILIQISFVPIFSVSPKQNYPEICKNWDCLHLPANGVVLRLQYKKPTGWWVLNNCAVFMCWSYALSWRRPTLP